MMMFYHTLNSNIINNKTTWLYRKYISKLKKQIVYANLIIGSSILRY